MRVPLRRRRYFICRQVSLVLLLVSAVVGDYSTLVAQETKSAAQTRRLQAQQLYKDASLLLQEGWEEGKLDYAAIEVKLKASISMNPTSTPSYLLLGRVYEEQQAWKQAIAIYRQASRKSFDKQKGFVHLGRVYARVGKTAEAKKILSSIVGKQQTNGEAEAVLASIMRREGDYVGAEKVLRSALSQASKSAALYRELALVYLQMGRDNSARLSLLKGLRVQENDAGIHNTFGLLHLKSGDENKAVESFQRAVEIDGRLLSAHLNLGAIYLKHGYFAKALEQLKRAERLRPQDAVTQTSLGVAHRGMGNYDLAEASFKKALQIDRDYQPAVYNIGILYYKYLQDRQKAATFFEDYVPADAAAETTSGAVSKQVSAYLARIAAAAKKQTEVDSDSRQATEALESYKSAKAGNAALEKQFLDNENSEKDLIARRKKLVQESVDLERQVAEERKQRLKIEKDLRRTIADAEKTQTKITKSDEILQATAAKVVALEAAYKEINAMLNSYFSQDRQLARSQKKLQSSLQRFEKNAAIEQHTDEARLQSEEKAFAQSQAKLRKLAAQLSKQAKSVRSKGDRLLKSLGSAQRLGDREAGGDEQLAKAMQAFADVEAKMSNSGKTLRGLNEQMSTRESEIEKIVADLKQMRQKQESEEATLWALYANRDTELTVLELDKQREISGKKLQALERERKKLLSQLDEQSDEVADSLSSLRQLAKEWDKQVEALQSRRQQLDKLQAQQGTEQASVRDSLQQLEKIRRQIDRALSSRKKLAANLARSRQDIGAKTEALLKAEKSLRQSSLATRDLLREVQQRSKQRRAAAESLRRAQSTAAGKISDATLAEQYREVIGQMAAAEKERDQRMREFDSISKQLLQLTTDQQTTVDSLAKEWQQRDSRFNTWQTTQSAMADLLEQRALPDRKGAELRRAKRELLAKRRRFAATRGKLWSSQADLQEKRLELLAIAVDFEKELEDALAKRQQTVRRDLLQESLAGERVEKGK